MEMRPYRAIFGLPIKETGYMRLFTPLPRLATRLVSLFVLGAWGVAMAVLVHTSYIEARSASLATDLARYGAAAEWRGVYYRGEKIGFSVSQTVPASSPDGTDGFELQEDARLQMSLLGATTPAAIHTTARVDRAFSLQSFEFSLDPGTGPVVVRGTVTGTRLALTITSAGATRTEARTLDEPPALSLNLARRLAGSGLRPGARYHWFMFDPATLRNEPVAIEVGRRELGINSRPTPAFRVDMEFAGLRTTSWITDTGDVVREESPLGLITIRESPERARATAISGQMRTDLLRAAAVVPTGRTQIDDARNVRRLKLRVTGLDANAADLQGGSQRVAGDIVDLVDPRTLTAGPPDGAAERYLAAEPFIESDDPDIRTEAERAVAGVTGDRARAERLTRYVNGLLDKKPTVSLPSAREVLRTKVGDCNEHTVLLVAMARALGIPARISVGLVYVHGAFYYHAWPEVYVDAIWLPVDPTLNEFPADTTHLRVARGGLDKQAAVLPLIGRLTIAVLDVEVEPDSVPILAGSKPVDLGAIAIPLRRRDSCCVCR